MTETKTPIGSAEAMETIAKIDPLWGFSNVESCLLHASVQLWTRPHTGMLARIRAEMDQRDAHPARTVVVLPYAQLRPLATRLWTQCFPDGFAPRFETSMSWSSALGGAPQGVADMTFDVALDTLTAQTLLVKAGLGAQQDALCGLLVQAAQQLGPLAAACNPAERDTWAQAARGGAVLGMDGPALAWEAAVARVAVEWAAASGYASDVLFTAQVRDGVDALLVVQGNAADPLMAGLQAFWGAKWAAVSLARMADERTPQLESASPWALHACSDAEDEAQRSAACVLQHITQGRTPVALVSSDRALTRRVRAMLDGAGVQIRDENGWKLSTSHAAAQVMAYLKACVWNASTDAVLNWLKGVPALADCVDALEAAARRDQVRDWHHLVSSPALQKRPELVLAYQQVEQWRAAVHGSRPLGTWLWVLRTALQASGQWAPLQADGAGTRVLEALHLSEAPVPAWEARLGMALWAARRLDLVQFTHWANLALEGASFSPEYPAQEEVVILPMSQMLGRPFAAVVLAGCDEVRLNPSPEPPGGWTAAQRAALGLPSRETLEALTRAAWRQALQTPVCDVLWRTGDESGETLLPSPLVQLLQLDGAGSAAQDPRTARTVASAPVLPPRPTGALVPVKQLSASAYEDLRDCPYRFFALRQLGLKSADELDAEVDKRDFGLWLHEVLKRFHEAQALAGMLERGARTRLLDEASAATTQAMGLPDGEFLPFAAAWPAVREGYLGWLIKHEASGAVFASAETEHQQNVGDLTLVGRIDRIDTMPDGSVMVLDYKTEPSARTSGRVKDPMEDTQIAFYAALLPHDTLQAAYVNVGERDATRAYVQTEVVHARDALIDGMLQDLQHIREGAALPALGDGSACEYCSARGLCRKDFWAVP